MVNVLKFGTLYSNLIGQNVASFVAVFFNILGEMANSVDPDKTAPSGAV